MAVVMAADYSMAGPPKKWTLQECIDYAIANNISLQQSELSKRSAEEDVKQAKSELMPREFGIIILCNKPAFINDVNIE